MRFVQPRLLGLALVLSTAACASGGTVVPRGSGDGGRGGDVDAGPGSSDDGGASVDAGPGADGGPTGSDAGPTPVDAGPGPIDGGPPPIDGGPPAIDAGRDAGRVDAGRVDGGCASGSSMGCTTACGTIGVSTCSGGGWGPCAPPPELCNDRDDDCDGTIDDGFACRIGASGSCATSCGSTGTRSCGGSCSWGACAAPAETCNGADDDCDARSDEGFRATVINVSYASDLASRHAPCNGTTQRLGPDCNAAIHRHCAARGCTTSGFGPGENADDRADVTCVVADVRNARYSTLATYHGGCVESVVWGTDCNAAIHRYCAASGFVSGYGPVEHSGDDAYVACVASAAVITTSYSTLVTHHGGCNGTTQRMGPECNAAIHRFCGSMGHTSGFGPVENSGDTAVVTCVRP